MPGKSEWTSRDDGLLLVANCYRWIYNLVLCMDACFRLSNRLRSSESKDPPLGPGWAYMVSSALYHNFLRNYIGKEEVCL